MTTQQGELLIRQRNPQTQRPEWARAYVVLAVDERQLFCFTDEKFDAPRCVLQLRGASVGRVDGARDGTHRFSVVTDAPPPRSFLPAAAAAALAAGAATASLALAGAALLALAAALLAAVAPRVQRAGGAKVLLAATSRRRAETWRQHVASCVEINQCVGCTFLGDDAAVLARSSGGDPTSPPRRAGVAPMAWRTGSARFKNAP